MNNIDLILVDYQDTGSRYTTYTATLSKVFESASDYEVPVFLIDRPNPIRGDLISGPIPRLEFQSFESYHLFPIRHGLTIGEMALIINEMGWIKDLKRINLNIKTKKEQNLKGFTEVLLAILNHKLISFVKEYVLSP